jgi:multidrug efflux system membrane fusion protein
MRRKALVRFGVLVASVGALGAAWRLSPGEATAEVHAPAPRASASGLAGAAALASGEARKRPGNDRPVPVQTATVRASELRIVQSGLGTVVSRYTASVKSRVSGQLVRVHFTEGEFVKQGQLLAELDPRTFQAEVKQGEGQVARGRALLDKATLDLKRYEALGKEQLAPLEQVELRESLVKQYEGELLAGQGLLQQASLQLAFSRITAPIGGRIGLRQVDPGNIVGPNDATGIAVINAVQPICVVFTLPEDAVPAVMKRLRLAEKSGQALEVEAWDKGAKNKLGAGKLLTIDNQIDSGTGTVKLKAEFANEDLSLFPNQFVNVRLLLETQNAKTVIPSSAVQRGSIGAFVYTIGGGGTASIKKVKLGTADGADVSVDQGLSPGDLVVTSGADRLREGALVLLPKSASGS